MLKEYLYISCRSKQARSCADKIGLFLLFVVINLAPTFAQTSNVKVTVTSFSPPRLRIEGERKSGAKAWSFLNVYAGASGLAERVENLSLADAAGKEISVRRLTVGEYESTTDAVKFSYDLKLDPPTQIVDAAHVSWLNEERGLFLLSDLLPRSLGQVNIHFEIPVAWNIVSIEREKSPRQFEVMSVPDSVFLIGRNLRSRQTRAGKLNFTSVVTGNWAFSDDDASQTVRDILNYYESTVGRIPHERIAVLILPFPSAVSAQTWSAETRGRSVILLTGSWPSRSFALSRLDNVLCHELFHLWSPNGLSLDGEYGWFYEGFTLYQSLRAGVRRGQLTFQDFLNAIGRAYDNYQTVRGSQNLSLIDASLRRWSTPASLVYDRGMIVAFLYELTLMQQSDGRNSLDDVYRALFREHGTGRVRTDGNRAVIGILEKFSGKDDFVNRFVKAPQAFEFSSEITKFGLQLESAARQRSQLLVSDSLTKQQRTLLQKLGYNKKSNATSR